MTTEYTPTTTEVDEYFAIRTAEVFEAGASWLAEYLLSDENVERAARVIFEDDHLTQIGWDEVDQRGWLDCARSALQAVLGKEQP